VVTGTENALGLCHAIFTELTNGTWTLHEEDFTVDAITNPLDAATPPVHGNVTENPLILFGPVSATL